MRFVFSANNGIFFDDGQPPIPAPSRYVVRARSETPQHLTIALTDQWIEFGQCDLIHVENTSGSEYSFQPDTEERERHSGRIVEISFDGQTPALQIPSRRIGSAEVPALSLPLADGAKVWMRSMGHNTTVNVVVV